MHVLVTGGAGFIGSHTVDLLLDKGYQIRVLDNLQERVHPQGWPDYLPENVERVRGDVTVRDDWHRALDGIDAVVHLAAYQDYMPDFSTFMQVNAVSTALLFEIIVEKSLPIRKVVSASSQAVYGEGKFECPTHGIRYPSFRPAEQLQRGEWELICSDCGSRMEPRDLTEDRVNPHTAYGISKYALEMVSHNLGRKYGIPTVNMRYSIVQGPRNSFFNAYSGICRIFTLRLLHDQPPICYEDGGQLRDYVYVGDVARANVLALEENQADYGSFNVGGLGATSVIDYARTVARVCGKNIEPQVNGDYRFGDTRHTVSSWDQLRQLGWRPEVDLENIIADYVEWVRRQPNLEDFYARTEPLMRAANIIRRVERD